MRLPFFSRKPKQEKYKVSFDRSWRILSFKDSIGELKFEFDGSFSNKNPKWVLCRTPLNSNYKRTNLNEITSERLEFALNAGKAFLESTEAKEQMGIDYHLQVEIEAPKDGKNPGETDQG